jgi:hypothetical protein
VIRGDDTEINSDFGLYTESASDSSDFVKELVGLNDARVRCVLGRMLLYTPLFSCFINVPDANFNL